MAADDQPDRPEPEPEQSLDAEAVTGGGDAPPTADAPATAGRAEADEEEAGAPPSALALADARRAVEAICMVSSDPVPVGHLAQLLELSPDNVAALCRDLALEYHDQRRGFAFIEVAGGWRYQSHPDQAPYIERYVLEGQSARLSPAALETLAILAYKQPLSRAQVSAIRGVNVDGVLRTLVNRGYVAEVGRDSGPGQAVLYGTTPLFLEKLGLAGLHELPPLGDFVPGAHVVEALEQTLRATPGGGEPAGAGPGADAPEPEAGGGGPVGAGSEDDDRCEPDGGEHAGSDDGGGSAG